jgi:hypothetical protein
MNRRHCQSNRKHEHGTVLVFVTIGLGAFLGLAAWATETGRVWQAKNQLQAVADSASLAGVGNLFNADFTAVDSAGARSEALAYGPQHVALGTAIDIAAADVAVGGWDLTTQTFTPMPGSVDPDLVRAVRVRARRDADNNGVIPATFGRAIGYDEFSVAAESIAYWGVAGGAGPGAVDLPIAIDCCKISGATPGSACTQNYCDTIQNAPPNPCPLANGDMVTCFEFFSSPEQNACWTALDGGSSSINTNNMSEIIADGNQFDITGPIYIDNGTKTPLVSDIYDKFHGEGSFSGDPAGVDTDTNGSMDSWVVKLPVVECQNPGDGCAGGDPQIVVGFVCFDIQEVIVTPDKIIKGSFLCSTDPRCDNGGFKPGGGLIGGIPSEYPVIVN